MNPNAEKSPRQKLLEEAIKITTSDRNQAYGNPEDNFENIARLWNVYLTAKHRGSQYANLHTMDVANMMALMKIARLATNPTHRDSAVDIAGYAACMADCQVKMNAPAGIPVPAVVAPGLFAGSLFPNK